MRTSKNYKEFLKHAEQFDKETGRLKWREKDESS